MTQKPVVLFGGSFDPLHNGHMTIITSVMDAVQNLDRIVLIPSSVSPGKDVSLTPDKDRYKLLQLLVDQHPLCDLSPFELNKGGTSWTIETLHHFRTIFPTQPLQFVMGSDQFFKFHEWKSYAEILQICSLLIVNRGELISHDRYQSYIKTYLTNDADKVQFLDISPLEVSSSEIRKRLKAGRSFDDLVPAFVHHYYQENNPPGALEHG
ncbi:nicotinate (nicotinamide) nucleotide adenylyltransferase [Candidatus Marinamargulisbacteria bacterium SCGC AG-439-L15]|nr:nicotinate (nicotinamide) nucleotide adenylyltransferase [Candidatus Marinamargulisbacteria bacterium SCGC AG-439-L15]